jgi:hypothetical protein
MKTCAANVRFRGQSGHTVLHCKCLLLTQSGLKKAAPAFVAIGVTADIGDWGTRAHWNFVFDISRDGAALRPTVASRNYPTLAFKSHNPAPIGPAFEGTDRGVSKWCCARAPQSAALQFFLSIHPLQWPSREPSMLIHILAECTHILVHRPLRVAAMHAQRAKARDAAPRRELPWASPSLARHRCMIPFSMVTMKAA